MDFVRFKVLCLISYNLSAISNATWLLFFLSAIIVRACIGFYYCLNLGIWELFLEWNLSIVLRMQSDEPIFLSLKHLFVIHSVSITIFRNQISDVKSPREGINIAEWIMHNFFLRNANQKKNPDCIRVLRERFIFKL